MAAAERGFADVIDIFARYDANLEAVNAEGIPALMIAARHGSVNAINSLAEADAAVDATDTKGATALHYAASHGQIGAVEALLQAGATVDIYNNNGSTANAISQWHLAVTRRLLQAGARVTHPQTGRPLTVNCAAVVLQLAAGSEHSAWPLPGW
jgi:hypothetical protein